MAVAVTVDVPAEPSSNASRSPPRSSATACCPRAGWMHLAGPTTRVSIDKQVPGYWRVTLYHPPINTIDLPG